MVRCGKGEAHNRREWKKGSHEYSSEWRKGTHGSREEREDNVIVVEAGQGLTRFDMHS